MDRKDFSLQGQAKRQSSPGAYRHPVKQLWAAEGERDPGHEEIKHADRCEPHSVRALMLAPWSSSMGALARMGHTSLSPMTRPSSPQGWQCHDASAASTLNNPNEQTQNIFTLIETNVFLITF